MIAMRFVEAVNLQRAPHIIIVIAQDPCLTGTREARLTSYCGSNRSPTS